MTDWKRRLKHRMGWFLYRSGLHRRFLGDRAVIVLFHRVDESLQGNSISCTPSEFDAYCRFFRRYFDVISLGTLLERLEQSQPLGGSLVISFDDGYLDNWMVAAPVLRRYALPASFFVSTGFIGSRRVPWWDAEEGVESRWMSWEHVRELAQMGFDLGAHTVNHTDLGKVEGEEARSEIVRSRERLEGEIGIEVPHFSYPYGRYEQMTEDNRELVRREGFRCCLSAYGGSVRPGADPFELRRLPISPWYLSPYHFGWEILFGNDRHVGGGTREEVRPPPGTDRAKSRGRACAHTSVRSS